MEAAYRRYRPELLGFAIRALSDRHLAEDLVQDTFTRAWRSAGTFDPARSSVRTWLFSIARNGIVDALRRRHRRNLGETSSGEALAERSRSDPIERLLLTIQVREALDRLSPEHRHVIVEVHYLGRTCADLAAELGVPAGTMRSRLFYAVRALRSILEENGWLA
ncbi:sigma-70 family RNA polymerase sigma factor [Kribbella sancticallisti]|uniref:Sigma-70 family RNA polymerase sigma factor n=1 Tax=Kribbella sancticallisti TaxID=460087 RepID=A0ABP4QRK6_9ACTN